MPSFSIDGVRLDYRPQYQINNVYCAKFYIPPSFLLQKKRLCGLIADTWFILALQFDRAAIINSLRI